MPVMLRGQNVHLALEEEQWDRILLGYLTWETEEETNI